MEQQTSPEPSFAGPGLDRRLRSFQLPSADGGEARSSFYRQRRNLVVFFHHGGECPTCRAYLGSLAERIGEISDEETVVLAVGQEGESESRALCLMLDQRLRCLADPSGKTVSAEGLDTPALLVADRFGQLWAGWAGGPEHLLPSVDDLLGWLRLIELQCPE